MKKTAWSVIGPLMIIGGLWLGGEVYGERRSGWFNFPVLDLIWYFIAGCFIVGGIAGILYSNRPERKRGHNE